MLHKRIKLFRLKKRRLFDIIIFLLLLYFIFHSIYGKRGFIAYFETKTELVERKQELELLRAERLEIENKAKLLRPDSLDRDMLDEKIRNILGFSSPKEKIFSTKRQY